MTDPFAVGPALARTPPRTAEQHLAVIHAALGVDRCPNARAWHVLTREQKTKMLAASMQITLEQSAQYAAQCYRDLPAWVQDIFKNSAVELGSWCGGRS